MKIFCLMRSGKPLTDKVADVLFENAHEMIAEELGWTKIQGKDYNGEITTEFEHVSFGCLSGIVFHAIVDTEAGETDVQFVVREKDLDGIERGRWFMPKPIPVGNN